MIKKISIILLFAILLANTSITIAGATEGLNIWYKALIPALLPFMILSNIIINMDLTSGINFVMRPITLLLKLEKEAGYSIFAGLFFGYPACATTSIELLNNKKITNDTANICICSFNNLSPAFISGYICTAIISDKRLILPIFLINYLTIFINAFIVRYILFKNNLLTDTMPSLTLPRKTKNIMDAAINSSMINIAKLGIYVIIFSIMSSYIKYFFCNLAKIPCLLTEITTGSRLIKDDNLIYLMPFIYFGGICGIFQTFSIDINNTISKKKYILSKTVGLLISLILCIMLRLLDRHHP